MELQDWRKEPRKKYSNEFKLRMVELASQPGACVAQIARENGVNDNVIFKVSAPSATSCENCPVWQQSRPSILMDTNDEFPDNKRYSLLPFLFA